MPLTMDAIRSLSRDAQLALIMEEAAELIHAASKARRFGETAGHASYNNGAPNFHAVIREAVELNNLCRAYCAATGENWGDWSDDVARRAETQIGRVGPQFADR